MFTHSIIVKLSSPPTVIPANSSVIPAKAGILIAVSLFLLACPPNNKKESNELSQLTQKGQVLFNTTCTACHNSNPKFDGAIGPAITGSSLELLKLKVRKGEYPTGHKPKRETKVMTLMPQLSDNDIKAIHAYLESF